MSLKEDLKQVPSWVWLGGAAGVGLIWVLTRGSSSGASTATSPAPASTDLSTTPPITASPVTSYGTDLSGLYTGLGQLQQEIQAYMEANQPAPQQTGVVPGINFQPVYAGGNIPQSQATPQNGTVPTIAPGGYYIVPVGSSTPVGGIA